MRVRAIPSLRRILLFIALATLAGGLLAGFPAAGWAKDSAEEKIPPLAPELGEAVSNQLQWSGTFAPVVRAVLPAVVSITASRVVPGPRGFRDMPFFFGPRFRDFFGERPGPSRPERFGEDGQPPERRQQGLGSGVVISPDGTAAIAKSENNEFEFLQQGSAPAGVINSGDAANRVRADCLGDTLSLYANGQQIVQVTDDDFESGWIGLIAGTRDEPDFSALFDNLTVLQP